jgi:endogenous inhibitor of DNA gyrase (YacG/DUF329 family)
MYSVMMKCPKTGNPVPTGFLMGLLAFENSDLSGGIVHCPHCLKTHHWRKSQAFLDLPQGSRRSAIRTESRPTDVSAQ